MIKTRTLAGLGAALSEDIANLAARAGSFLSLPGFARDPSIASSLGDVLDRLCLSMTMAKPVGLAMWARRESGRFGRAPSLNIADAATRAIAHAATQSSVDQRRLRDFLDMLTLEIERFAINGRAYRPSVSVEANATAAVLAMMAARDCGLYNHSRATSEWVRRLAKAMKLSDESTEFISSCALLHDVGKVETPDAILFKESSLDEDEWVVMRDHAAAGQRILEQIPSLQRFAVVVRSHHERYDGAGYPDGLTGNAIALESRILAVADSYHAMISDRPYRQAIAPRDALSILAEGRGSQWDPKVVDAMLALLNRRPIVASRVSEKVSSG